MKKKDLKEISSHLFFLSDSNTCQSLAPALFICLITTATDGNQGNCNSNCKEYHLVRLLHLTMSKTNAVFQASREEQNWHLITQDLCLDCLSLTHVLSHAKI